MAHADFDLAPNGYTTPTHGGARRGAGTKPAGYVKPDEAKDYDRARARNEDAKAGLNEIELKRAQGEYLSRTAFREACATLLSEVAQALRSIPDQLERKHALPPTAVQMVEQTIDNALSTLAGGLELFTGAAE